MIKSYGATWDEIRDRYSYQDYNVYLMWEWFITDTTFSKKVENQYGSAYASPINAVIYGQAIVLGRSDNHH
ncbi:MAG: hypothetical protein MJ014_04130 [Methanocorpusculum sp.]|nr:hypothetical protein [Methanocorpusculum sp.]